MTRTEQLLSIGLLRIEEISKLINLGTDTIRYRIKLIGIIPFERWWYDEYQLEIIRNYEIYKQTEL